MTEPNKVEKALINKLPYDYKRYIENIRAETEKIVDDEITIVRNYTKHDFRHSQRVVKWANAILGKTTKLTEEELFLLLAGCYLHDIGMHCDLTIRCDVKMLAEMMGAKFEVDFKSHASGYSTEEQKALRDNHHYVSAAWLVCDNEENQDSAMSQIIRNIPKKLFKAVLDICKYHSSLDLNQISEDPHHLSWNIKKIAALLRLADELDIDENRINIETVKNKDFPAENRLYWWLHNSTEVYLKNNLIFINVVLCSQQIKKYGGIIKSFYLDRFVNKNKEIIDILNKNNVSINISAFTDFRKNDYFEIPKDILSEISMFENSSETADVSHEYASFLANQNELIERDRLIREKFFKYLLNIGAKKLLKSVPLSLIFFDIDSFESINKKYGTKCGDLILNTINVILSRLCKNKYHTNLGGDQFIVYLEKFTESDTLELAETIRSEISIYDWSIISPGLYVTASFGVSFLDSLTSKRINIKFGDFKEQIHAWIIRAIHGSKVSKRENGGNSVFNDKLYIVKKGDRFENYCS